MARCFASVPQQSRAEHPSPPHQRSPTLLPDGKGRREHSPPANQTKSEEGRASLQNGRPERACHCQQGKSCFPRSYVGVRTLTPVRGPHPWVPGAGMDQLHLHPHHPAGPAGLDRARWHCGMLQAEVQVLTHICHSPRPHQRLLHPPHLTESWPRPPCPPPAAPWVL